MERVTLLPSAALSDGWIDAQYLPEGKDKYYIRNMQVKAPENVRLNGTTLSWDAAEGAIGYVVCAADTAVAFTCQTTCTVPDANGTYTVRSANEMGGLGEPSQSVSTSINPIVALPTTEQKVYSIGGTDVTGKTLHRGIYIVGRKKVVWGN